MRWVVSGILAIAWIIWLLSQFHVIAQPIGAYGLLLAFVGAALGLLTIQGVQPILAPVMRLIGSALVLAVIGQILWAVVYPEGASGNDALLANIPSYISAVLFALAAFRLFRNADELFGISKGWLIGAAVGAVLIVVALTLFGPKATSGGLVIWANGLSSALSSFTALLMIGVGMAIRGGTWSRWVSPIAVAFAFYLLGNIAVALTTTYNVGSPSDWLWMVAASVLMFMVIRESGHRALPAQA